MSETSLIEKAQAAVGDVDTITAAARCQPRGTSGGLIAGDTLGDSLGSFVGGDVGQFIGGIAGGLAGEQAAKHTKDFGVGGPGEVHEVPFQSLLAVSESRLYLWRIGEHDMHMVAGDELLNASLDDVRLTVHGRIDVHTLEIERLSTGEKWELEAERLGSHLKYVTAAVDHHGAG